MTTEETSATTAEELVSIPVPVMQELMGLLAVLSQDPLMMSAARQAGYSSASSRKVLSVAKEQARAMVAAWGARG